MQQQNEKNKILFEATGKAIMRLRIKNGLSLNLFAYENDLQKSMVSRLERGVNEPKLSSIWKIAEALNISLSDFMKEVQKELPDDFSFIDK